MNPIDPAREQRGNERPPMAPPYVDENAELASIEEGLDLAEDERREAVADDYVASARMGEETDESLRDIDFSTSDESDGRPAELDAIHIESIPEDDEEP